MEKLETLMRRAAGDPRVIGFAGGLPSPSQFPRQKLALSFIRVMRQSGVPALQYGWAEGSDRLRHFVAERLRARGAKVAPEDIIVTSGAQQAIAIALELVTSRGDQVAVDSETYPAALELFRCRGLIAREGLLGAACAYVMPVVSNPRGQSLDQTTREALLDARLPLIEDDAYADLRFIGPPPSPLLVEAADRVFHVGTFSKILCPGLRVGWLVVPHRFRQRALELKQGLDLQSSSLAQAIVEDYILGGEGQPGIDLDDRLVRLRRFYRRRALALAKAVRRHLPSWSFTLPEGGFALWIDTNSSVSEEEFLTAALDEGVVFDPGSLFRPSGSSRAGANPDLRLNLRLCFSYASPAAFEVGVRRLAVAWSRVASEPREQYRSAERSSDASYGWKGGGAGVVSAEGIGGEGGDSDGGQGSASPPAGTIRRLSGDQM